MIGRAPFKIFSCTSSLGIAEKIADHLGIELGKSSLTKLQ